MLNISSPPAMSRSSSCSTLTLVPTTPPPGPKSLFDSPATLPLPFLDGLDNLHLSLPKKCVDLTGPKVVKPIKTLLTAALAALDRPLRIVGLLATSDSGCHMYADMTARACKAAEVLFDKLDLSSQRAAFGNDEDAAFALVSAEIEKLNIDGDVDGLIVYFPLFSPERDAALRRLIHPRIDVEGVHPTSLERSYAEAPQSVEDLTVKPAQGTVYPCTALAVFRALQAPEASLAELDTTSAERFRGRTITVINRSETVGRPLAGMLANAGARVFSVDIDSTHLYQRTNDGPYTAVDLGRRDLAFLLAQSDAVVSAVPGESFKIPTASLQPGAVCVDLSEHGNFDADVRTVAGVFAPRLGSVTILMLKMNALVLHLRARRGNGNAK